MVVAAALTSWGCEAAAGGGGLGMLPVRIGPGVPGPVWWWGALGGSPVSCSLPMCLRASAWQLLTLPRREEEK